jgi:hypothetical protein
MNLINVSMWGTAIATVLVGFSLAGCSGGGGGGGSSPDGAQTQVPAPESVGGNRAVFHSGSADARVVTLHEDNTNWTETRDGTTVTGTYRYAPQPNTSAADLYLTEEAVESHIALTFNSPNSGAFVNAAQQVNGTFELQPITPDPDPEPPNDGLAPSSLAGKTMNGTRTFTSTGPIGQTHVYTFSLNSFHDSDPPEESEGSYLYQPNGNTASLTLNYYSPASFNGDTHDLQMTFHTADAGVFQSLYTRRDGTVIRINGTFTLE